MDIKLTDKDYEVITRLMSEVNSLEAKRRILNEQIAAKRESVGIFFDLVVYKATGESENIGAFTPEGNTSFYVDSAEKKLVIEVE